MLTSNDTSKVIKSVANDLIKRELVDISQNMDTDAKINFVNSVRSLVEVSEHISKELNCSGEDLLFLTSDV